MNDTAKFSRETESQASRVSAMKPPAGTSCGCLLRFIGKALLALSATALTLAAGEWVVRWRYPEYGIPVFTTRLFTEYDPLLGWRKIPNFHGTHVQDEYTIIERFNSKGLRGPEYSYKKPDGEFRILILGDSFAEGYTVEFEELCSELLKKKLNTELDKRIEVINAGTGGYGTDQELLFFRTEGVKYEPDLVIVLYCENDAPMNIKSNYYTMGRGQKPLFELADGKLTLKSIPQKTWDRTEEAGKDLAKREHDYKKPFELRKPETWYLYRLCKHVMAHRSETIAAGGPIEQVFENAPEEKGTGDNRYRGRQDEWIMTEALMAQLKKEAVDAGAKFLLYNIPQKGDVYGAKATDSAIEHNLRVMSVRHEMAFIPTVATFRKRAAMLDASGKRLYWKKDSHWTAEGHRLTAEILSQFVLTHRADYGL
jgi:hypothetical protein